MHRTSSTVHKARRALGLHPQAPIYEEHDIVEHADLRWTKLRAVLKEPLAEFFGVMVMVFLGDGSVAQVLLSEGQKVLQAAMALEITKASHGVGV